MRTLQVSMQTMIAARILMGGDVGQGSQIPYAENEILDISNKESYRVGAHVWQVGAGLEVRLWRRLYADGELKYTRTREKVDNAEGAGESLLKSTHEVVGQLVWHLSRLNTLGKFSLCVRSVILLQLTD
jgi:hypothetical protein